MFVVCLLLVLTIPSARKRCRMQVIPRRYSVDSKVKAYRQGIVAATPWPSLATKGEGVGGAQTMTRPS
jgi:hypothetical protein